MKVLFCVYCHDCELILCGLSCSCLSVALQLQHGFHCSCITCMLFINCACLFMSLQAPPPVNTESSPDYANLADFNLTPPQPLPDQQPTKEMQGDWDMYIENTTGRQFYFNKVTKESTWKPPRGMKERLISGTSTDSDSSVSEIAIVVMLPLIPWFNNISY